MRTHAFDTDAPIITPGEGQVHDAVWPYYNAEHAAQVLWCVGDRFHGFEPGGFFGKLIEAALHADNVNLARLTHTGFGVVYAVLDYKRGVGTRALLAKVGAVTGKV